MFRVTNISGGLLVCTLADDSTLRLKDGATQDVSEAQMTKYLHTIEKKKLVKIEVLTTHSAAPAAEKKEA